MNRQWAAALLLPLLAAAGLPHAQGICGDTYEVVRGDTLYSIARLCRGSVAAIAAASGLADPTRIEVGQRLVIRAQAGAARPPAVQAPQEARGGYRVRAGDTLFSLARRVRVGLPALIAANPGIDPRKIEIGDLVRLPRGAGRSQFDRQRGRATAPAPRRPAENPGRPEPEPEGM